MDDIEADEEGQERLPVEMELKINKGNEICNKDTYCENENGHDESIFWDEFQKIANKHDILFTGEIEDLLDTLYQKNILNYTAYKRLKNIMNS